MWEIKKAQKQNSSNHFWPSCQLKYFRYIPTCVILIVFSLFIHSFLISSTAPSSPRSKPSIFPDRLSSGKTEITAKPIVWPGKTIPQSPDSFGKTLKHPRDRSKQGIHLSINCLLLDSQGILWIGTDGFGLFSYNPALKPVNRLIRYNTNAGLGDGYIYALSEDKLGRIWAGHLNHGVSVFNRKKWRNYGPLKGPLGERVFNITTNPNTGNIWIASSRGLACYRLKDKKWLYLSRVNGLPSDQISAIAFDRKGRMIAGTQCDGLFIGKPGIEKAAHRWEKIDWVYITGPDRMPNSPSGTGLPSSLINDVLVSRDGTIYVATDCGLAISSDHGINWSFFRGKDWKARVEGLYIKQKPDESGYQGALLLQDYITCLAEDEDGKIWIGYRMKGVSRLDPKSGKIKHCKKKKNKKF